MFSAADDEQWRIITRHIDESDYYCVIVAHRYGSTVDGISFTHKEYEYALSKVIPVMGFIIEDSVAWPAEFIDKGTPGRRSLSSFKALVKSKPVSFWKSGDDLYGKVSIALSKAFTANPREGWVRSSATAGPELTQELTRLSAENARLREELKTISAERDADKSSEVESLMDKLMNIERVLDYKYSQYDAEWVRSKPHTIADIFLELAPSLATELELRDASNHLAMSLREDQAKSWWLAAINQVRGVLSDLMALSLVEPSGRKHAVADKGEYWTLTELGTELHRHVRLTLIEERDTAPEEDPNDDMPNSIESSGVPV